MARLAAGIQQETAGKALSQVTGLRLRRLHALFARHWGHFFHAEGVDLSSVQGGLLLLIGDNPGLPQAAFARLLDVEPPSLAQTLAPLVESGLVERRRDAQDGRAMAAEELGVPLKIVEDTREDGREKYGCALILVRPDQFIVWAGDSVDDARAIMAQAVGR